MFFCSDLSRNACESLYGTAGIGQVWFLLEHPQPWGQKALATSRVPERVKATLNSVLESVSGGKFLLIRQGYSPSEFINFFVAVTRESAPYIRHFRLKAYEDLMELDLAGLVRQSDQAEPPVTSPPLYLVCTDGNHDKCCAKYGLRTYQSLKSRLGDCVWESSHVGGDRFAANVVCFPHGLFFGHALDAAAERIVSDYQNGRIYLSKYRGRSCYSNHAQVGEFFIRSEIGDLRLDSLRLIDEEALDQEQWQVRFRSLQEGLVHTVKFQRKMSEFENQLTCHSEEIKRVAQYALLEYSVAGQSAEQTTDQATSFLRHF